jgi:hypothetical protein
LVTKVKVIDTLEKLIPRIGKYMQWFKEMRETLSFPMDQHGSHTCIRVRIFTQWVAYDGEHAIDDSPSSHKSS